MATPQQQIQELDSSASSQEIIDKINEIVRSLNSDLWGLGS